MDFAKAFDKVPHQHLLYKLKYYGISCNAYDWISDFLTDRTQTVLEGEMSSKAPDIRSPPGHCSGTNSFSDIYVRDGQSGVQQTNTVFTVAHVFYSRRPKDNPVVHRRSR